MIILETWVVGILCDLVYAHKLLPIHQRNVAPPSLVQSYLEVSSSPEIGGKTVLWNYTVSAREITIQVITTVKTLDVA